MKNTAILSLVLFTSLFSSVGSAATISECMLTGQHLRIRENQAVVFTKQANELYSGFDGVSPHLYYKVNTLNHISHLIPSDPVAAKRPRRNYEANLINWTPSWDETSKSVVFYADNSANSSTKQIEITSVFNIDPAVQKENIPVTISAGPVGEFLVVNPHDNEKSINFTMKVFGQKEDGSFKEIGSLVPSSPSCNGVNGPCSMNYIELRQGEIEFNSGDYKAIHVSMFFSQGTKIFFKGLDFGFYEWRPLSP